MNLLASNACFTFDTQRLHVRPLSLQDSDIYCFIYTDEEMMRFVGEPLSPERARRSFLKAAELTSRRPLSQLYMAVIDRATREALGVCSIQRVDARRKAAEVGIMLRPAARDRKIAPEALTGLISAAFTHVGVLEVWAEFPRSHAAARQMLTGLGFSFVRNVSNPAHPSGLSIWSVLRRDWLAMNPDGDGRWPHSSHRSAD